MELLPLPSVTSRESGGRQKKQVSFLTSYCGKALSEPSVKTSNAEFILLEKHNPDNLLTGTYDCYESIS